jgi:hypothetical protein
MQIVKALNVPRKKGMNLANTEAYPFVADAFVSDTNMIPIMMNRTMKIEVRTNMFCLMNIKNE